MRRKLAWSLAALLVGACAVPNVDVVDSLDDTGGTGNDDGGTKNGTAGTKNGTAGTKNGTAGTKNGDGGTGNDPPAGGGGNDEEGGAPAGGTEGNPGGGTGPTAGSSTGGSGGSTSPPADTALGKFCNDVSVGGDVADFELHIGSGDDEVVFTATTGTCIPIKNRSCVAIPTGDDVPINVYFAGDADPYWVGSAPIEAGQAIIFGWVYDETLQEPKVVYKSDYTPAECKSTDYSDLAASTTP